jgi:hypothetical protein
MPLGVERRLQPREQLVEGVAEFLELVVGSWQGQAFVQAASGDPPGGGGDRAQRAQHAARQQPPGPDRSRGHDAQGDGGPDQQQPPVDGDLLGPVLGLTLVRLLTGGTGAGGCRRLGGHLDRARRYDRAPREQVGSGEQERAEHQAHAAVQDGKAQPGGTARQPRHGRGTGSWPGDVHYGPPMR